ncbi:MAG TPA: RNA 2',3'-cyclic phosphodiesterase [Bacillota bacterium]
MRIPHYFIAIPLQNSLKRYFANWSEQLKKHVSYKQWTDEQDLHITLKFLGGVNPSQLSKLNEQLKSMELPSAFSTIVGSLGTFGKPSKPRVLWVGVHKNDQLVVLQQRIEVCASEVGFPKETRTYRPHITLAKKWNGSPDYEKIIEIKENYRGVKQMMPINELVIYRIHPRQIPKYERVLTYDLK